AMMKEPPTAVVSIEIGPDCIGPRATLSANAYSLKPVGAAKPLFTSRVEKMPNDRELPPTRFRASNTLPDVNKNPLPFPFSPKVPGVANGALPLFAGKLIVGVPIPLYSATMMSSGLTRALLPCDNTLNDVGLVMRFGSPPGAAGHAW